MNDQPATLLTHDEVRPQSFRGRGNSTRLQKYRRKMRKRRNRRMGLIILATTVAIASFVAYKMQHPEFHTQKFVPQETLDLTDFDQVLQNAADKMESSIQQIQKAMEQGFASINNIINGNDSAGDSQDTSMHRKSKSTPPIVEEPVQFETSTPVEVPPTPDPVTVTPVESTVVKKELVAISDNVEERPAFCNLPLSYIIHRKCWTLASKNPVFNLHGLVQDMMQ